MTSVNVHNHDHLVIDHGDNFYQHLKRWHSSADESDFQDMVDLIKRMLRRWSRKTPDLLHYLRSISNLPVYAGLCKSILNNPKLDSPLVSKIDHKTVTIDEAKC
ncbi:uncharacterized protein UTRI_10116 [Ustilago trichophora]|uniref:Uncharacterized protein n=1 Tax=Ustilago trichophora TaxID=86804 RepID=A0A5C3E7Y9_9BASI|nr:uncharacterized protein UTRI_10116 [Ustilago trichophora]